MILLKNASVYAPEFLGKKDILICQGKIEAIEDELSLSANLCTQLDCNGLTVAPGLIDPHVHITGGGGEGSFHTQVPPVQLSQLIQGGVTCVVGLLGTDGISRSVENLVAKAKSLTEEGITAYACTGSYGYPSVTITGDVKKDILFIHEILGTKLAVSDHRAPHVSFEEFTRLASDCRVAGMLAGKCGMLVMHMGDDPHGLELVRRALQDTAIPAKTFHSTHVNRRPALMQEAFELANKGCYIDMTCGGPQDESPAMYIQQAIQQGVALQQITLSSDGMGSWSVYDDSGNLLKMGYSAVDTVYLELRKMVQELQLPLEQALCFATKNTAQSLGLYPNKGCIRVGSDADFSIFDADFNLQHVIAGGRLFMQDSVIIRKGCYEPA